MAIVLGLVPSRRNAATGLLILILLPVILSLWRRSRSTLHRQARLRPEIVIAEETLVSPGTSLDDEKLVYHPSSKDLPNDPSVISVAQSSFLHTDWYHVPRDKNVPNFCDAVSADHVQRLVRSLATPIDLAQPLAFHYQNGSLVTPRHSTFSVTTGFCTLFIVPQTPWLRRKPFEQLPIEGLGPDTIQAEMSSPDVRLVFTDHPVFWGTTTVKNGLLTAETRDLAVYAVSYALNQPGAYQLQGDVEWHYYDWAMERPIDMVQRFHEYRASSDPIEPRSPALIITGNPVARPKQACYRDSYTDLHGRWYRASSFGAHGNQTALNVKARVEFADKAATIDDWGWTFAPDACSLFFFTAQNHEQCFRSRSIQIVGDSNARRVLKSVIGGGERWCPADDPSDRVAQCEDRDEEHSVDFTGRNIDIGHLHDNALDKLRPTEFGLDSKLFLDFVGGIVRPAIMNSWGMYLEGGRDLKAASELKDLSVTLQRQQKFGRTDVVFVSLVTWDVSHILTPAETLAHLPDFRKKLLESFSAKARIVIRLANSPSHGNYNNRSRFAPQRFQMFNTMWREFWEADHQAGRVRFDDASVLQGRADAERSGKCTQTHLRCSHVRIEAQIWMNAVCEKLWNGKAQMRDW